MTGILILQVVLHPIPATHPYPTTHTDDDLAECGVPTLLYPIILCVVQ